mgnify:CR=1 FL=1
MPESGIGNNIDKWRKQRLTLQLSMQQTLICSTSARADDNLDQSLQSLCDELIDYVSTGHFSIYSRPLSFTRQMTTEVSSILQGIYQYIGSTTDQVLLFNDRVESCLIGDLSDTLHNDLLKLKKSLSVRFALEEQLLELGTPDKFRTLQTST